jgi:hypothetical protein
MHRTEHKGAEGWFKAPYRWKLFKLWDKLKLELSLSLGPSKPSELAPKEGHLIKQQLSLYSTR